MRLLLSSLFLAVVLLFPSGDPRPDETVDDLVRRADPAADDWSSEALQARAAARLGELAAALVDMGVLSDLPESLFVPGARATPLLTVSGRPHGLSGGLEVRVDRDESRSELDLDADFALGRLAVRLHRAGDPTIRFKVVGVEGAPETGWTTRVRYEGVSRKGKRVLSQVGYWTVRWERARKDAGDAPLRIASIRLESFEEVATRARLFQDATGSVLPAGEGWVDQLRNGGEYWYGRLDSLGGANLFGHQGIAVGDFDGDGLEDLYVAQGNGLPNKLLLHREDGTVRDAAAAAGVDWLDDTKGVLFADTDNDGDRDLLMAVGPTIVLCKNDGEGKCERFVSMRAPTSAAFYSLSAADFDLDGDLDIYGTRYVEVEYGVSVPIPFHDANNGPTNHLMRNDGDDRFTDATRAVGLGANNTRFSLIGVWEDYDDDGDPDLYVANDFGRNNLYRNDGGKFTDVAAEAGVEDQAAGMGVSWSDYDLDGDMDLHVTNMYSSAGRRIAYQSRFQADADDASRAQIRRHALGNSLYANQGDGTFREVSDASAVRMGRWGWGAVFADVNADGYDDIVVPNGFVSGALEDDL